MEKPAAETPKPRSSCRPVGRCFVASRFGDDRGALIIGKAAGRRIIILRNPGLRGLPAADDGNGLIVGDMPIPWGGPDRLAVSFRAPAVHAVVLAPVAFVCADGAARETLDCWREHYLPALSRRLRQADQHHRRWRARSGVATTF